MNVLMFAFACDPDRGSEPGAGYVLAKGAAGIADDLHVLTRDDPGVPERLKEALGPHVTIWSVKTPRTRLVYVNYLVWIVRAAAVARRLQSRYRFDVVHHATYASDWFLNPLHLLRKKAHERWVWGPAGGATYPPIPLLKRALGSGWLKDLRRSAVTRLSRTVAQRCLRSRLDCALALNDDSAEGFRKSRVKNVRISSNLALDYSVLVRPAERLPKRLIWASRTEAWKGIWLAAEAFSLLDDDWEFVVLGGGGDAGAVRQRLGAGGQRISVLGAVTRADALSELARSTALILPSLHDSAPWVAGEAAGLGVPVICLDLGGVSAMAGPLARVVPCRPVATLAERLSQEIEKVSKEERSRPAPFHTMERLQQNLRGAYLPESE